MVEQANPEQEREQRRRYCLNNLIHEPIRVMAGAYFVENSRDEGETDKRAMDAFYQASLMQYGIPDRLFNYFNEEDLGSLVGSRQEGRRYSGNISEISMIRKASRIFEASIPKIKVEDLIGLIRSDGVEVPEGMELSDQYKDKYIEDLPETEKRNLIGGYMDYFIDSQVTKARAIVTKAKGKRLVEMVQKQSEQPRGD